MTLIELLVVVGIMGLLAAIAVPQFARYRSTALDAGARSDLRNAAVAEESYFTLNNEYTSSVENLKAHGFRQSQGVTLTIEADAQQFSIKAKVALVPNGPGSQMRIDGDLKASIPLLGGKIEKSAAPAVIDGIQQEGRTGRAWLADRASD